MENVNFRFASLNGNKIIQDETALTPHYANGKIFHKNEEEKVISAIMPLAQYKPCMNLFIHGPSGSGKTILVKKVLDHLKLNNQRILCIYINCWYHSTSMAIYTRIADELGEPVSRRGRATDEIFDRIVEIMKKSKTPVLLVLDEIDGLMSRGDTKILHNIGRIWPEGVLFGLISVSEDKNIMAKLPPKIRDSLRLDSLELPGANKDELLQLLKTRSIDGLAENSYSDEVLEKIAEIGEKNRGNMRLALEMLWKSAKLAETKEKSAIGLEEVEATDLVLNGGKSILTPEEQILIEILNTEEKTSSEVYWLFCKQLIRTKKQIRNYLAALEGKRIIETRTVSLGNKPKFKLIKLKNGGV